MTVRRSANAIGTNTTISAGVAEAALALVEQRYLLAIDLPEILERAAAHYNWAVSEP